MVYIVISPFFFCLWHSLIDIPLPSRKSQTKLFIPIPLHIRKEFFLFFVRGCCVLHRGDMDERKGRVSAGMSGGAVARAPELLCCARDWASESWLPSRPAVARILRSPRASAIIYVRFVPVFHLWLQTNNLCVVPRVLRSWKFRFLFVLFFFASLLRQFFGSSFFYSVRKEINCGKFIFGFCRVEMMCLCSAAGL